MVDIASVCMQGMCCLHVCVASMSACKDSVCVCKVVCVCVSARIVCACKDSVCVYLQG